MTAGATSRLRDCTCPRVRHRHGTEAAYTQDNCRCFPCAIARHRYVQALRAGLIPERRTATIHGTRARLQALTAIGWSPPELAQHCTLDAQTILRLRAAPDSRSVLFQTRDQIAAAYDLLWDRPSTGPHAARMRNLAARNGWRPPLALDDDVLADPPFMNSLNDTESSNGSPDLDEIAIAEVMAGRLVPLTKAETVEVVARLTATGASAREISQRLGRSARTVQRKRAVA